MSAYNLSCRYELLCESRLKGEAVKSSDTGHFSIPKNWLAACCARDVMDSIENRPSTSGREDLVESQKVISPLRV